jgi:sterol desaturase/sphingolipid hydroxylase (fatty acid hydroxylase superfamily)
LSRPFRSAVRWIAYPGILGGTLVWGHLLLRQGHDHTLTVAALTAAAFLAVLGVQRLFPFEESWRRWARHARVDALHAVLSSGAVPAACKALTFGVLFNVADTAAVWFDGRAWPTHWDVLPQVALAVVLGELGHYWAHRWMHATRVGWRIHSVHHSSERLYVLSSGRSHPLNVMVIYLAQTLPLALLGAHGEVLALLTLFTGVNGFLQHANIDVRVFPLNWLVATSDLHRFHHSLDHREGNSNFGGNVIVWDVLFGTRYLPATHRGPSAVGLVDAEMPEGFWRHLLVPFRWRRLVVPRTAPR